MITVLSPAKKLVWDTPGHVAKSTPAFREDAAYLAGLAACLTEDELSKLMGISPSLARLNAERFRAFAAEPADDATRPAVCAFAGDTYQGLDAGSLQPDALSYAQGHLRILSGLYGVLRPHDAIQPYRLEMGSRLVNRSGKSLYAFWGSRISAALNAVAEATASDVLVNCASQEYFGAVDTATLRPPVVTPVFLEDRGGAPKVVSFYAKKARGAMARFIVENRLRDVDALADFDTGGYRFAPDLSEPGRPAFLRAVAARAAA